MRKVFRSVANWAALQRAMARTPGRHKEASVIASLDAETAQPSARLLDLSVAAAGRARTIEFADLDRRSSTEERWYRFWPGEHYRLLAALVTEIGARKVIEIGTSTGMGTLAIAQALPTDGHVTTFDLVPWRNFCQTWLTEDDFASGRVVQEIADIAKPGGIAAYRDLFQDADFIFIDGPKDGVTERHFINALGALSLKEAVTVMFDDIRVVNMIEIWRRIDRPKMDMTSFGHWSGTGLVDWNG
jgi:predicted O-methyltransferase YrrM